MNRNKMIILLFISCLLVILNSQISALIIKLPILSISEKMSSYSDIFEGSVGYASYLIRLFIILTLLYFYKEMSYEDKKILQLYMLSIFFYSLFFNNGLLATRINLFFKVLDIILIANVIYYFKVGFSRIIILTLIVALSFSILSVNFGNEKVWNYQVIQKL